MRHLAGILARDPGKWDSPRREDSREAITSTLVIADALPRIFFDFCKNCNCSSDTSDSAVFFKLLRFPSQFLEKFFAVRRQKPAEVVVDFWEKNTRAQAQVRIFRMLER